MLEKIHLLGGVYMRKLAPAQVSHWDDFFISYGIYMMTGSFHILLFKGTFQRRQYQKSAMLRNLSGTLVERWTDFFSGLYAQESIFNVFL